jgi:hypothetical protein
MVCDERSRAPSISKIVQAMCHKRQQINMLIMKGLQDLHSKPAKLM